MKYKYSLFFLILFLFFNMTAISAKTIKNTEFHTLEENMSDESCFIENGLKVQFKTTNNLDCEYLYLKQNLINELTGKCNEVGKNSFAVTNDFIKSDVNLWESEEYTYVEIIIVNINSKYNTEHLEKLINNIMEENIEDMSMFLYYKGKVGNKISLKDLETLKSVKKSNVINISNGYTGTGVLNLGEKLNFALVNYGDESYIIIGTPIIFTTY